MTEEQVANKALMDAYAHIGRAIRAIHPVAGRRKRRELIRIETMISEASNALDHLVEAAQEKLEALIRFKVSIVHGEGNMVYHAIDTKAPKDMQPAIVRSWSIKEDGADARFHASEFCARHNAQDVG